MKRSISGLLFVILFSLAFAGNAFAKGSADQITISGPGLAEPVMITEPEILHRFSPWSDEFFDLYSGVLPEPPKVGDLYEVVFYFKDSSGEMKSGYTFQYAPGEPGYIYLPGLTDEVYLINSRLILREQDGNWLFAGRAWESAVRSLLPGKERPDSSRVAGSGEIGPGTFEPERSETIPLAALARGDALISPLNLWLGLGVSLGLVGVLLVAFRRARKTRGY